LGNNDNGEERLGRIAGIYRVNSDGTIEALESVRVEAAEEASMFVTDEGIVLVVGPGEHDRRQGGSVGHLRADRRAHTGRSGPDVTSATPSA
jgi:hypothetical protein